MALELEAKNRSLSAETLTSIEFTLSCPGCPAKLNRIIGRRIRSLTIIPMATAQANRLAGLPQLLRA